MRTKRTLAVIATAIAVSFAIAIAAPGVSFAANSSDSDVTTTLSSVTSGLVQQAAPSTTDANSAAQTAAVDVPFDPAQGVTLKQDNNTTVVGLPDAQHLSRGVRQTNGVVIYRNSNGSDAVVVPTANGAQFLTVIENAAAPEDYTYRLTLAAGQAVQVTNGGYALVLDSTGKPVSSIAVPWAQGGGLAVATSFMTNGTALVQHIAHKASGTRYPVVGDPWVNTYAGGVVVTFSRWETAVLGATAPLGLLASAGGWIGGRLMSSAFYLQVVAAYAGAIGQCLWAWVSWAGGVSAGTYRC